MLWACVNRCEFQYYHFLIDLSFLMNFKGQTVHKNRKNELIIILQSTFYKT